MAAVAAWVSYRHAYDVVLVHGEDPATARLVPLTVDGLVYASSMVLLHCARHRLPVPALARVLLALGIAATLAANLLHGAGHGPVGAVIAAWPAVALVGSYELLMLVIRSSSADPRSAVEDSTTLCSYCRGSAENAEVDLLDSATQLLAESPRVSGAELGRRLGVSERHGRRVRARLTQDSANSVSRCDGTSPMQDLISTESSGQGHSD